MFSSTKFILGLSILPTVFSFVSVPLPRCTKSSSMLLDSIDDSAEAAAPLTLSVSDLQRLASLKSRHHTLPLLIMDAIVPGQTMSFESSDPKFHNLVRFCLQEETEIAMIGVNPHTGRPLNQGVTLPLNSEDVIVDTRTNVVTVNVQAKRRFEVQGEPWLHHEQNDEERSNTRDASFYLADVEIVDDRPEEPLPDDLAIKTQNLADQIPNLVGSWVHHLVAKNRADALKLESRMVEQGPLPKEWKDQAFWVASLLNPSSSDKASEEKVCLEIRPAMLSCKNDHERMILATAALQCSIDHITGERELF